MTVGLNVSNWEDRCFLVVFCFTFVLNRKRMKEKAQIQGEKQFVCIMLKGIAIETYRYKCNQNLEIWRNQDCDANLIVIYIERRVETMETKMTEIMKGKKDVEKSTIMWNT